MSTGRKLLFSLLTVVLAFALAEGGLRLLGWPQAKEGARFTHAEVFWVSDPNLDDKPTMHKEVGATFPVSTDANGVRGPAHPVDKPADAFRVLAMGCSTTFGWGVSDEEAWPAQLEAGLRAAGHPEVEVINGGQPGYTTLQGLWLWDEVLNRYEPDLVILGFIVQDARRAAWSDLSQALLTRNASFLQHNVLYNARVYTAMRALTGRVQVEAKERDQASGEGVYRVGEADYLDNLRALRSRVEAGGGRVVHFGFPLEVVGYTETHRRLLRLEAERADVPWFDPSEVIAREARNRTLYFPQDRGHANAAGNALIAGLVRDFLTDNDLLRAP